MISDLVLVESKAMRDSSMANLDHEMSLEVLNKAKALMMAVWRGTGAATTEQLAEYYEVPVDTVKKVLTRSKQELESDGLQVVKGKDLKDARDKLSLASEITISSKTSQNAIWTPRAALRLGMLLNKSEVARQVRTEILNLIEHTASQAKLQQQQFQAQLDELLKILEEQAKENAWLSYRVSYQATQTVELWRALTKGQTQYRHTPFKTEADKLAMTEKVRAILESGQRRLTLASIAGHLNAPIDAVAAAYVEVETSDQPEVRKLLRG